MSHITTIKGLGADGKAKAIGASGLKDDSLKVIEKNNKLLKDILLELKAIKRHQAILTEVEFDGTE